MALSGDKPFYCSKWSFGHHVMDGSCWLGYIPNCQCLPSLARHCTESEVSHAWTTTGRPWSIFSAGGVYFTWEPKFYALDFYLTCLSLFLFSLYCKTFPIFIHQLARCGPGSSRPFHWLNKRLCGAMKNWFRRKSFLSFRKPIIEIDYLIGNVINAGS